MTRRPRALVAAALLAGFALAGCATPAAPGGSSAPGPGTATDGRQGWRVSAVGILGEWQPEEYCGGDYVFTNGMDFLLLESLTDLSGNDGNSGPYLMVAERVGDGTWGPGYSWTANTSPFDRQPGDLVQGGQESDLFVPDASGHPLPVYEFTGGSYDVVDETLGWEVVEGKDWLTLRFERIPEPEWCIEDETYYREEDPTSEFAWTYYD